MVIKTKNIQRNKMFKLKKIRKKKTNVSILFSTQQVNDVTLAKNKS